MSRVDLSFIADLEGAAVREGYVPDPEGSRSGVTIGTGFDLGQHGRAELERLGLAPALVAALAPYLGVKGAAAVALLRQRPLTLTVEQVRELDARVMTSKIDKVIEAYDGAVGSGGWASLPPAACTVIASVAFQYGDLPRRCPRFWERAVRRDWPAVIAELRDFGDRYPTRRRKEADHLERGLA